MAGEPAGRTAGGRPGPFARAVASVLRRGDARLLRGADEILVLSRFSAAQVAELDVEAPARTTLAPAARTCAASGPARDAAEPRPRPPRWASRPTACRCC
jgi:hypothetical protein